MPKRAPENERIDPVRAAIHRLSGEVATPNTAAGALEQEAPVQLAPRAASTPHASRENADERRKLTVNRKAMFTQDEAEELERTMKMIGDAFGGRVNYTQVTRAMWVVLSGAEQGLLASARRSPRMKPPSTGNPVALAEYEDALADFLSRALRRS